MKVKEPKFMKDLRQVRSQMAKEWKGKSSHEIVESIHYEARTGRLHAHAKKNVQTHSER